MAQVENLYSRQPLRQRGQGAVESILALPVFLTFVCLVFQLFFLGMAQIQLQYAAFYGARVGAVHSSDKEKITNAVKQILLRSQGNVYLTGGSFEVEILNAQENSGKGSSPATQLPSKPLIVRVHWYYPLVVPLADLFLSWNNPLSTKGRPSIHLKASWTMTTFPSIQRNVRDAKK